MRVLIALNSSRYYLAGTCINSFDEDDGSCIVPAIPYRDVSDFAVAEEHYKKITKQAFEEEVEVPNIKLSKQLEYYKDLAKDILILYDVRKDIHYFFVKR